MGWGFGESGGRCEFCLFVCGVEVVWKLLMEGEWDGEVGRRFYVLQVGLGVKELWA